MAKPCTVPPLFGNQRYTQRNEREIERSPNWISSGIGERLQGGAVHGPKPLPLELSDHERRVLRGWLRKQTASQALVLRSRIVLACAEDLPDEELPGPVAACLAAFGVLPESAHPVVGTDGGEPSQHVVADRAPFEPRVVVVGQPPSGGVVAEMADVVAPGPKARRRTLECRLSAPITRSKSRETPLWKPTHTTSSSTRRMGAIGPDNRLLISQKFHRHPADGAATRHPSPQTSRDTCHRISELCQTTKIHLSANHGWIESRGRAHGPIAEVQPTRQAHGDR